MCNPHSANGTRVTTTVLQMGKLKNYCPFLMAETLFQIQASLTQELLITTHFVLAQFKKQQRDFPGGPVGKTLHS